MKLEREKRRETYSFRLQIRKPSQEVPPKNRKRTRIKKLEKTFDRAGEGRTAVRGPGRCSTVVPRGAQSCDLPSCFSWFFRIVFGPLSFLEIALKVFLSIKT